jgi:O-glycosyl hydrolase
MRPILVFFAAILACVLSSAAFGTTSGPILVTAESPRQEITDWGYDIKQRGKAAALDASRAAEVFGDDGMTLLRIPILAGAVWGQSSGHPRPGEINTSVYAESTEAVRRVQAVKPDAIIFASIKNHVEDFPNWVQYPDGSLDPERYARLLFDFLSYMQANQVTISVLGVDNERVGQAIMTPAKHNKIVTSLTALCLAAEVPVPLIIAPEPYGPSATWANWLKRLAARGWGSSVGIAGTHYYSRERKARGLAYVNRLAQFGAAAGRVPLWGSEFQWQDVGDDYSDGLFGLISAFDHFDSGFQGIVWWNFHAESDGTTRGQIQTALVTSTTNAYPISVDDQDGRFLNDTKLSTRAFKQGRDIVLWILNDTATTFTAKSIRIPGETITPSSAPTFTRWKRSSGFVMRESGGVDVGLSDDAFPIELPRKSITYVRIPDAYPPQVDDNVASYSGSGWSVTRHRTAYEGTSHKSSTRGDRATYTFTGTGVQWLGSVGNIHGRAKVYIDGVLQTTWDSYAPAYRTQKVKYSIAGLAPGQHTIDIEVLRTRNPRSSGFVVDVDAFYVL